MTQKTSQNPWSLDVRVRERNLKSGVLTEKDLDKHLAALPDVGDQAEPFATGQPALADNVKHAAEVAAAAAAAAAAADAEADEGDDDEADDGEGAP